MMDAVAYKRRCRELEVDGYVTIDGLLSMLDISEMDVPGELSELLYHAETVGTIRVWRYAGKWCLYKVIDRARFAEMAEQVRALACEVLLEKP